jgi:tRNA-2-methylthio-N6-dimethylallyladenosine synthase
VPGEVASERLQELLALQDGIQRELNGALVDREMEVVVTGWGKNPRQNAGRTPCHRVVHFEAEEPLTLGSLARVRIERALTHSLSGRLAGPPRLRRAASALPVVA